MKDTLEKLIRDALLEQGISQAELETISIEHPGEMKNGDYATNAALVYGKRNKKNPVELAVALAAYIDAHKPAEVTKVEVAGPGFINFYLSPDYFAGCIQHVLDAGEKYGRTVQNLGKKTMVEYTDPNPFKIFHIGHLMSNTIGEAISRLIEWNGAEVKRANYQGDVGRHVALTIWGIRFLAEKGEQFPDESMPLLQRIEYLGRAYATGATKFKDNEAEYMPVVQEINKKIYEKSDEEINMLYSRGREWSLEYFETIYDRLGTKFDFYFFESDVSEDGIAIVKDFLKQGIFEESDGAIVFKAEKYDPKLHTRVFLNSQGLPTYEAKELGLNTKKFALYPFDLSIIITGNEVDDYFRVLLKALELTFPEVAEKTKHISHGMMRLPSGKMSSRTGDVISAESLLQKVQELVLEKMADREIGAEEKQKISEEVAIAALKYAILKQAPGRDIIFDFEKSLSFEGDSGPYLQYAHTRALSVLAKAEKEGITPTVGTITSAATVEKLISRLPDIVERAGRDLAPQLIVTYLIELASAFNSLYAEEKIVDAKSAESPHRVALTKAFATTLKNGLSILGIKVPEKM